MARGAYHIFRDHPWIGSGVGTIVSVYPAYETAYDATIVDHVHDDHFELLAETGAAGRSVLADIHCVARNLWIKKRFGAPGPGSALRSTWNHCRMCRLIGSQFCGLQSPHSGQRIIVLFDGRHGLDESNLRPY